MLLGEIVAAVKLDVADLMANAAAAEARLLQLESAVGQVGQQGGAGIDDLSGKLVLMGTAGAAAGAVLATGIVQGVTGAAQLEQAITNVSASLGGLDDAQLSQLTADMQELGANSQFSAVEVAGVADALAKAGTAVGEIRGVTEAVIDLSSATGAGLSTSVDGIIAAMSTWSVEMVGIENALTDASRAADIFTVAANQSSADVDDLLAGMRNLGPIAAQLGISFEEASAGVALFTDYGLKGADAGVSLARGLQNLANPASEVSDKLAELGLSMDSLGIRAYDLEGNFVGLPALFDQLKSGMSGLDQQTRLAALSIIFGAEALDVMSIAAQTGSGPLAEIVGQMDQTGIAAEQAAARTDTLVGAWQRATESGSTALNAMFEGMTGPLQSVLDMAASVADVFTGLPGPIRTAAGAVVILTTGLISLNAALMLARAGAGKLGLLGSLSSMSGGGAGGAARGIGQMVLSLTGLARIASPLGLALTGVAVAGGALAQSFMEQKAAADDYRQSVSDLEMTLEQLRRQGDTSLAAMGDNLGSIIDQLDTQMDDFVSKMDQELSQDINDFLSGKFLEDYGHAFDPSDFIDVQLMESVRTAYADEWQAMVQDVDAAVGDYEVSIEDMTALNAKLNDALSDPNINAEGWIEWASGLLESADSAEELDAAVEQILSRDLSDFRRLPDELTQGFEEATTEAMAFKTAVDAMFSETFSAAQMDDLRIDGLDDVADQITEIQDAMREAFAPTFQANSFDFENGDFLQSMQESLTISELTQDELTRLGTAWDRIQDKLASGDFDNAQIMADILEIISNTDLDAGEKVAAIEALSTGLDQYAEALSNTEQAMLDWIGEGDHILDFWLEYSERAMQGGAAAARTEEQMAALEARADFRALVQFTADLEDAKAGLDQVLRTFQQIDDLGSRSEQAGSIATNLIGEPGEWGAIDDMLARWLEQAQSVEEADEAVARYNQTVEAGTRIQESNARVQQSLNDIRADQLPLLADEQEAYEQMVAKIAEMEPLEQRRVLAMQDAGVQAQLASQYATAYSASLGEIPPEVATSMIVSAAEADPVLKDLLLQFGLIEEGADGEIRVNFPDGETVQESITSLTDSIDELITVLGGTPPGTADALIGVLDGIVAKADDTATALEGVGESYDEARRRLGVGTILLPSPEGTGPPPEDTNTNGYEDDLNVTGLPNTGTGPAPALDLPDYSAQIAAMQEQMTAAGTAAGQAAGAGIAQGALNALPVWVTTLTAFTTQLTTQSATWQTTGTTAGQTAGAGIAQGALNALPVWVTVMTAFTTQITNAGPLMSTAGLAAGQAGGAGVAQGALNALPVFVSVTETWPALIDGVAGAMGASGMNAGAAGGYGVANGMDSASGQITGIAGSWPGYIDGIAGAMGAAGFNAGAAAGFGVANGLASAQGAVEAAAGAIIAAAALAMQAMGEIASPSRLTRREVGRPLGQGVVLGLDDMRPAIAAAAGRVASAAIPDVLTLPRLSSRTSPMLTTSRPTGAAGGGGTVIYQGPTTIRAEVHAPATGLSDADRVDLARDTAMAIKAGVDLMFLAHGADEGDAS